MSAPRTQNAGGWLVIDSELKAQALLAKLSRIDGPFGIDTETTGIDPRDESPVGRGQIVCWSLAWTEKPNPHGLHPRGMPVASRAFIWADYLKLFKPWLEDPKVPKVGHNVFTFDRHMFANHGICLQGVVGCTLRMSRFLNADSGAEHGLKSLMQRVMGYVPVGEYKELFGRCKASEVVDQGPAKLTRRKVEGGFVPTLVGGEFQKLYTATELLPLDAVRTTYAWLLPTLYDYASLDAKATLELFWFFRELLRKRPATGLTGHSCGSMWDLYEQFWNPGLLQITEYERAGVDIDEDFCARAVEKIDADLAPLQAAAEAWAPGVNWRSAPQYGAFLYTHKGFKVPPYCGSKPEAAKRTKPGKLPGDFVALSYIADLPGTGPEDKAGLRAVLAYKRLELDRRFAADLPTFRSPLDNRIHTVMAPEADTGRLSARNPALQQIPKHDRYRVRKAFTVPEGFKLIVADYSQLEMYVAGHFMKALFGDDTMERLLAAGDMHTAMARKAWPVELGKLTDAEIKKHPRRDHAKAVGYGLFYGKSAIGLGVGIRDADGVPIGTEAAQVILDAYHAGMPALAKVQHYFIDYGRKHWGIHTLLGRFRPVADIHSEEKWRRGEAERQLLNTPIQGSAHDVVATAMLRTNTVRLPELMDRGHFHDGLASLGAEGVLQVHDELQWRVPVGAAPEAAVMVKQVMENPFPPGVFSLPLKADVSICDSWGGK